jgi:hypothetical protein
MPDDEDPMTREEAERYQRNLSMLARSHVEEAYRAAFSDCALINGKLPGASTIQRLLCVWKVLWRWRKP